MKKEYRSPCKAEGVILLRRIGAKLRLQRKYMNISRSKAAKLAGVEPSKIRGWEMAVERNRRSVRLGKDFDRYISSLWPSILSFWQEIEPISDREKIVGDAGGEALLLSAVEAYDKAADLANRVKAARGVLADLLADEIQADEALDKAAEELALACGMRPADDFASLAFVHGQRVFMMSVLQDGSFAFQEMPIGDPSRAKAATST